MNKELSSIVITLIILTAVFGVWFFLRYQGVLVRKSADDVLISQSGDNTLCLEWKDPCYGITGFSSWHCRDSVLHLDLNISRNAWKRAANIKVDTSRIRYVEIYGKEFPLKDIMVSKD